MAVKVQPGYTTSVGNKAGSVAAIDGPLSYPAGGQVINRASFGMRSIEWAGASFSVSGTYRVVGQPSAVGAPATWKLRWIVNATGLEVAATTNLSAEKIQVFVIGG